MRLVRKKRPKVYETSPNRPPSIKRIIRLLTGPFIERHPEFKERLPGKSPTRLVMDNLIGYPDRLVYLVAILSGQLASVKTLTDLGVAKSTASYPLQTILSEYRVVTGKGVIPRSWRLPLIQQAVMQDLGLGGEVIRDILTGFHLPPDDISDLIEGLMGKDPLDAPLLVRPDQYLIYGKLEVGSLSELYAEILKEYWRRQINTK